MTLDEIEKECIKFFEFNLDPTCTDGTLDVDENIFSGLVHFAEHILRVAESKRWQPIETAPKIQKDESVSFDARDEEMIVISWYAGTGHGWQFKIAAWDENHEFFVDENGYEVNGTHWQPLTLPDAPSNVWENQYHEQPEEPEVKS